MTQGQVNATTTGFRLSAQQERVWSHQNGAALPLWAICEATLAQVDEQQLKAAVQAAVERHEILRTVFAQQPGLKLPFQVIQDAASFDWRTLDNAAELQAAAAAQRAALSLENGPVLGVVLARVDADSHRLLLQLPALHADVRTLQNLLAEIVSPDAAGEEPLQYADIVEWQEELLSSDDTKAGREFWRDYFRKHDFSRAVRLLEPLQTATGSGFTQGVVAVSTDAAKLVPRVRDWA